MDKLRGFMESTSISARGVPRHYGPREITGTHNLTADIVATYWGVRVEARHYIDDDGKECVGFTAYQTKGMAQRAGAFGRQHETILFHIEHPEAWED